MKLKHSSSSLGIQKNPSLGNTLISCQGKKKLMFKIHYREQQEQPDVLFFQLVSSVTL